MATLGKRGKFVNDTIVIFRLPGGPPEVWVETVLDRRGIALPFRRATVGNREEAVRMADAILWAPSNEGYGL